MLSDELGHSAPPVPRYKALGVRAQPCVMGWINPNSFMIDVASVLINASTLESLVVFRLATADAYLCFFFLSGFSPSTPVTWVSQS